MTLTDLCEPILVSIRALPARCVEHPALTRRALRDELVSLLAEVRGRTAIDPGLAAQFARVEPTLILAINQTLGSLGRGLIPWVAVAAEDPARAFFNRLADALEDPAPGARDRLEVLAAATGIVFDPSALAPLQRATLERLYTHPALRMCPTGGRPWWRWRPSRRLLLAAAIAVSLVNRPLTQSPRTPRAGVAPDRAAHRSGARAASPLAAIAAVRGGWSEAAAWLGHVPASIGAAREVSLDPTARADLLGRREWPALRIMPLPVTRATLPPARYHPRVAEAIFAQYTALGADPADPSQSDALRPFSRYAADYVSAWASMVTAPVEPVEWTELHGRLSELRAARVNRGYRHLVTIVEAALAGVPSALGQDGAIAQVRTVLYAEATALDSPRFDEACGHMLVSWTGLGPTRGAARDALVRLAADRFESEFLEVYGEGPSGAAGAAPPVSRYWSSLVHAAAASVADAGAVESGREALALLRDTRGFPLCADSDTVLAPSALAEMRARAALLIRTGLASTPADGATPIARGGRTTFAAINRQLDRLTGADVFEDQARDRWAYQLRDLFAFLDPDRQQLCRIRLLGPAEAPPIPGTLPAAAAFPSLTVHVGDHEVPTRFFTGRPSPAGLVSRFPGPTISFQFQGADRAIELVGPWNIGVLLTRQGACPADDPSGRTVIAPLVIADAAGAKYSCWVSMTFDRPVPDLGRWLTRADWPG